MTIFLLFAETLAGRVIEVDSSTCDSVRCVKDKIQEKTGKSWEYQTLTSAGYELENERLVREFNTNKRPSLHLTLRVSGPLEMLVRRIGGNTFGIVVNPSDSITSVKEMIFEKEGIPVEEQEFMFAGQATNDYAALRAHMDRESMRHVVLHFRAVGRIHVGKISEFGCPLNITVQPSWTMKDLSEEVQATYGVPIEQQHWSLLSEGVDTD
ncbi:ubiquitin, partial [Perkinsus olseni]